MATGLLRALENMVETFMETHHLQKPYYGPGQLPPLKVIAISQVLPSLKLSSEEIVFVLDQKDMLTFTGFVLTDKGFHFLRDKKNVFIPIFELEKSLSSSDLKPIFSDGNLAKAFREMLVKISMGDFNLVGKEKKDPLKKILTSAEPVNTQELIGNDILEQAQTEGNQLETLSAELEADKIFMDNLQKSLTKSATLAQEFKPWHVMVQDLIFIFNKLEKKPVVIEQQFLLAYFFEKLQGNDMAENLSLERINQMITNPKFNESIEKVKQARFLEVGGEFKDQLILPVLLAKMEHVSLSQVGTHYNRIANLIAKADGTITKEEEEILQQVGQLCTAPKKKLDNVKQSSVPENETLEDVMKELNELVGLKNIKKDIEDLINFLKIQKLREVEGLKPIERALHSVFMGPPGTGKTTIARLLGRIFKHLGYISGGHLVETDRAGLVAGFVGQTALKVDEVVKAALNGVLFIDEAYSLAKDEFGRDFGHEAIEALLKRMEDHRDDLVVIAAGYPDEMKTFIQSNPGLQSRFNRYFNFEHYTSAEMMDIFKLYARKADFVITADAEEKLSFIFDGLYENRNPSFGNARVVRNLFEQVIANQANRLVAITPITKDLLISLEEPDIPEIKESIKKLMVFDEHVKKQA